MRLLADLGNTRLKCALADGRRLVATWAGSHAQAGFLDDLQGWLAGEAAMIGETWLASVAREEVTAAVAARLESIGPSPRRARVSAQALGVTVGYERVDELGVDRWLALLAARARGLGPCIVASVGSALTIDALLADGRHLGGLIAPTPDAMREALYARAPALPRARGEIAAFATGTASGIESGCLLASIALIERSAARLADHAGARVARVLSGGGAQPLRPWLDEHRFLPDLVLEGLALWAQATLLPGD